MNEIWVIAFLATFLGVGIGGILSYVFNGFKKSRGTIYAICTGLILGLISFEIAPVALAFGNWIVLAFGFLMGVLLFNVVHSVLTRYLHKHPHLKSGLILALIISIHNFPIGVMLGASEQLTINNVLLQTMILHTIPEGMILFTLLFLARFRFLPVVLLSFLLAIPVVLGAIFGEMIGMENSLVWAFLLSLTVGTIYMVTIKEILPEAVKYSSNRYCLLVAVVTFFLLGAYLFYI